MTEAALAWGCYNMRILMMKCTTCSKLFVVLDLSMDPQQAAKLLWLGLEMFS
jgi:hypothetical protein